MIPGRCGSIRLKSGIYIGSNPKHGYIVPVNRKAGKRPIQVNAWHLTPSCLGGSRRYITSCIDIFSRAGFAYITTSMSSAAAGGFFRRVCKIFPISYVLSDNGSKFKKYFERACQEHNITHRQPRCPKMNAHCE